MTATTEHPATERAGTGRWVAVVVLTLVVATAVGWAATFIPDFREAPILVVWLTFGLAMLAPVGALFWALIIGPTLRTDPRAEESVENRWLEKAMAGAGLDAMLASGVTVLALVFTSLDLPAVWVLTGVIALLMISTIVRYLLLSRREG